MINISPPLASYNIPDAFFQIRDLTHFPISVKIEGLNIAGSIKAKPALKIINELEKQGRIGPAT